MSSTRVKICGITSVQDAELVIDAGADMLGLNFVPSSKRFISREEGRRIVEHCRGRIETVAVVADLSTAELRALRRDTRVDALQLHGDESSEVLEELSEADFKAVRIATAEDVLSARRYRGPRLLVDAKVGSALGGTGHVFDWSLLGELVRERQVILAGGLSPDNVAEAVRQVRPWAVDVASGVEAVAPQKDAERVRAFVERARQAAPVEA